MKKKILLLPLGLFLLILLTFAYLLIIDRNPQEIPSNLINKKIPNFEANSLFKDEKFTFSQELNPEDESLCSAGELIHQGMMFGKMVQMVYLILLILLVSTMIPQEYGHGIVIRMP